MSEDSKAKSERKLTPHRYSGWPGAWCLDCGQEDPHEIAIAEGRVTENFDEEGNWTGTITNGVEVTSCPEPRSHRHDPYHAREQKKEVAVTKPPLLLLKE